MGALGDTLLLQDDRPARRADRRRRANRPRRRRRALERRRRPAAGARARRAARLVARRRRRRLHAGRRPGLARPRARPRLQHASRRSRSSSPTASLVRARRRPRARPVLGAARRRRQLRRRHGDRARAVPDPRGLRRHAVFAWERSAEVLHAWHAWTRRRRPTSRDLGRAHDPACRRCPRSPSRCADGPFVVVEVALLGDGGASAADACSRRCARSARRSTRSHTIPPAGLSRMHMDPPGPVPGRGDGGLLPDELTAAAIDALRGGRRPGLGLAAAGRRAAPPRRRARAAPRRRRRCRLAAGRVPALRRSARRCRPPTCPPSQRGLAVVHDALEDARDGRAAPVRRAAGRCVRRLPRGRLAAIDRGARAVRPGGADACATTPSRHRTQSEETTCP